MKKLFIIILIFALLLPFVVLAEDASSFVGVWVSHELLTTGAPSMSYLYLAEDHTSYYVIQSFKPDAPGLGRQYVGTWEITGPGEVYIKTGNNSYVSMTVTGDYSYDQNMKIYCHTPTMTVQDILKTLGYE